MKKRHNEFFQWGFSILFLGAIAFGIGSFGVNNEHEHEHEHEHISGHAHDLESAQHFGHDCKNHTDHPTSLKKADCDHRGHCSYCAIGGTNALLAFPILNSQRKNFSKSLEKSIAPFHKELLNRLSKNNTLSYCPRMSLRKFKDNFLSILMTTVITT